MYKVWNNIRPMFYSALLLLTASVIIQYTGSLYMPSFNLLASKGLEKIIFTSLVIGHVMGLALSHSRVFFKDTYDKTIAFIWRKLWIPTFLGVFCIFFSLHVLMLIIFYGLGYVTINLQLLKAISPAVIGSIGFGFIVTFFLAWTEELIFRGVLYRYFKEFFSPLVSVFIASLVFMLAHDITAPWNLCTRDWQLGLGLFLLGMMLNMMFLVSKKLYVGMGAHAGLVFVKVITRRIPLITYLPATQLPWWLVADLRKSHLTHMLFLLVSLILLVMYLVQRRVAR